MNDVMMTPGYAASVVRAELGSWMLGELNDDMLDDTLHDSVPFYSDLRGNDRAAYRYAVYQHLFA